MYELSVRIEPEPELFRYFTDEKTRGYCNGEHGLLIYPNQDSNMVTQFANYFISENIALERENSSKAIKFDCNCVINPPSRIRKLIKKYKGTIVSPVIIRNNWEHITIIIENYDQIDQLVKEINEYIRVEVIKIEKLNIQNAITYSKSIQEILSSLTPNQTESIIEAWKQGYYAIPRNIKTEELAKSEGISRYSFEKKIRKAENKIMEKLVPILLVSKSE